MASWAVVLALTGGQVQAGAPGTALVAVVLSRDKIYSWVIKPACFSRGMVVFVLPPCCPGGPVQKAESMKTKHIQTIITFCTGY